MNRFANTGLITPPWGVPRVLSTRVPSSSSIGAFNHLSMYSTAHLHFTRLRIPSFSNDPINTGKRRQFEQHGPEAFDQRPQAELRHHRYKFVEHGSLTKQRMSALF